MTAYALKVVSPQPVTDAVLNASNVPETDHAAYVSGTTYALAVRVVSGHWVYESVQLSNTGHSPATSPDWWLPVRPTNRWAMFDSTISTVTAVVGDIAVTLRPGRAVTAIGLLGLVGNTVRVRMVDPVAGTVYDQTRALYGVPQTSGWWAWFYGLRTPVTQFLRIDLPAYPAADILIDIEGDNTACATCLMGTLFQFGLGVQAGARVGITDFSRKERNAFGELLLVERTFIDRAEFELVITGNEVDTLKSFLASKRTTPCLWIGSSAYEATTVYGIYKSFDIRIAYRDYSLCALELESS